MKAIWFIVFTVFFPGLMLLSLSPINAASRFQYWPAPPPDAKIKLVESFSTEDDFDKSPRPWWKNLFNTILGLQEENGLVGPFGLGGDSESLFITDPGARTIWLVNHEKDALYRWASVEKVQELAQPVDIVVDPKGLVYVADSTAKKIFVFDKNAKLIDKIEGFQRPTGLAIDGTKNRLYVSDTVAHVVKVYDLETLDQVYVIGQRGDKTGTFNFPVHLEFAAGHLYVIDSMNFRVQIFDSAGNFISSFGKLGDGLGDFSRPKGIASDSDGNIYVVDGLMDNVQIFNPAGDLLLAFGRTGTKEGEFWLASDIFVDEDDRIYVADSYNHRVQVFQYLGQD